MAKYNFIPQSPVELELKKVSSPSPLDQSVSDPYIFDSIWIMLFQYREYKWRWYVGWTAIGTKGVCLVNRRPAYFLSATFKSSLNQVVLYSEYMSDLSDIASMINFNDAGYKFLIEIFTVSVMESSSVLNRSRSAPNGYSRLTANSTPEELSSRGKTSSGYGSPDLQLNNDTQADDVFEEKHSIRKPRRSCE